LTVNHSNGDRQLHRMNTKYVYNIYVIPIHTQNHEGLTDVSMFRFDVHIKELYVQIVPTAICFNRTQRCSVCTNVQNGIIQHFFEKKFCFLFVCCFFHYNITNIMFFLDKRMVIFFIKSSALFENRNNNNLYLLSAVGTMVVG
jgi:hypothetical protein